MKTIFEHLNELPKPFNQLALDYAYKADTLHFEIDKKNKALQCAFIWEWTKEGVKFWEIIHEVYCKE
jgi:hypothetical protein